MSNDPIGDGSVVAFHYVLTDDNGEELESTRGRAPQVYLHGAGNIVPGLEAGLAGRAEGDELYVVVEPADGYGERNDDAMELFDLGQFPPEVGVEKGMRFGAKAQDGQIYPAWIVDVTDNGVTVDFNHPLSGLRLHYRALVTTVRPATDSETEQGHPRDSMYVE
jgi:FKBP-type peptidyl-prolyl cis-trans isomerase SlyD